MADLTSLIKRLEAATAKLESIASPGMAPSTSMAVDEGNIPACITAFDELLNNEVAAFVASAHEIGDEVAAHADLMKVAFEAERAYILIATKSQKPAECDVPELLKGLMEALQAVSSFRDLKENRRTKYPNHLATMCEGIPALGWVTVEPKPVPFVKDMADASEFYGNRVLTTFRDVGKAHVDWSKNFKAIFVALQAYVKQYHTTGLVWNPKGVKATAAAATPAITPKPKAGGPPPPPSAPAPPPPVFHNEAAKPAATAALFSELSKGTAITSGLRKVDKSQMTHKNPELRASSVVHDDDIKRKAAPKKVVAQVRKGTPKFELDGKKWAVEWQENNKDIVINDAEMTQVVYIYKCTNSVIKVNNKVNSIVLDSCKKTAIVFDSVVASVEAINCQSVQVQVIKVVPMINIDKTDGIQVYLSAESLGCEIFTAKCSEMNISVPGATPEADMVEHPLPEQFRTNFNRDTGKFVTTISESV